MEKEYDFCKELAGVYKNNLFDNDNIRYYLNGFIDSLGIRLEDGNIKQLGFRTIKDSYNSEYIKDITMKKDDDCQIIIEKINGKKNLINLYGSYQDLKFRFEVWYRDRKIKKRDVDLPYRMSIICNEEKYFYTLRGSEANGFTYLTLTKEGDNNFDYHNINFVVNKGNIDYIFNIIRLFIINPKDVLEKYCKIVRRDAIHSVAEIDGFCLNDEIILDKKGKIYEKVLK